MEWIVACPEFPSPTHKCTSKAKSEFAVNTPSRPVSDQDRWHWKDFTCPCFLLNLMTSQYVQILPLESTSIHNSHEIQPKKHLVPFQARPWTSVCQAVWSSTKRLGNEIPTSGRLTGLPSTSSSTRSWKWASRSDKRRWRRTSFSGGTWDLLFQ